MRNCTTAYSICRGDEELYFSSEKAACDCYKKVEHEV